MHADLHERLNAVVTHVIGGPCPPVMTSHLSVLATSELKGVLRAVLPGRLVVTGTMDRRLVIAEHHTLDKWTLADLSGNPLATRFRPEWARRELTIETPESWLSTGTVSESGYHRLSRPVMLFAALYHPENFPLPRFPLAIHDLARAARSTLSGHVTLMDMQLGVGVDDIVAAVEAEQVDVLGVSATFGQHDIMDHLLEKTYRLRRPPLVIAGGSLTVRNEAALLERFPDLLIARGAGEPTIVDLVAYAHGDLRRDQIRGIGYRGAPRGGGPAITVRHTGSAPNRSVTDIFPELDLLDETLRSGGVAQLEASRGCTSTCSFCPRGHKGTWSGARPDALTATLDHMRQVFDQHPLVSRTVYLVDEEFIGRDPDAVSRAVDVAETVHRAGFRFESSCRVDQVVHEARDRSWHVERAEMWRRLVDLGLRGMLFGIESGVTSVLDRFHKETSAEQNVLAIRTLSALGVPTRFTYITFDHLMNLSELEESIAFQGRADLLLHPLPDLPAEVIVDGVQDPAFVGRHATGDPLYTRISYMAVSMECLTGAPYTRLVQRAGLAGTHDPAMGRVSAAFRDWRIGRCSYFAQLWVDRNFALDYLLKSVEKIVDGETRGRVRDVRVTIKSSAYQLLCHLVDLARDFEASVPTPDDFDERAAVLLDKQRDALAHAIARPLASAMALLSDRDGELLRRQYQLWLSSPGWRLINATGPCAA
jgi:Fe-S oxidoreductase